MLALKKNHPDLYDDVCLYFENELIERHWGIENHLHWHLDVTFGEDSSCVRKGNAVAVWNVLRKMALEYVKNLDPAKKTSLKSRRKAAAWSDGYLEALLLAAAEK